MGRLRRSNLSTNEFYDGQRRSEHWYRDNSIYFLTARCRDRYPAYEAEQAKSVFWNRFDHYTQMHGFVPIIESLMDNHYHSIGYLKTGAELGPMMRKLHGSVAKLVNDLLPDRRLPFWRGNQDDDYFDGCLRDEKQMRLAYRYTLLQSVRHKVAKDYRLYPHTRIHVEIDRAVNRAHELKTFLGHIPYKRYQ